MIEFTSRAQVEALLEMFGGEDANIVVEELDDEAHSGPGLYAYYPDCSEEGSILLDPPKDDDEARRRGG